MFISMSGLIIMLLSAALVGGVVALFIDTLLENREWNQEYKK